MTAATLTPQQCRAARALVRWSLDRLVQESGVGRNTISIFEQEKGGRAPTRSTRWALRAALERGGVGFLDAAGDRGVGVYLLKP